MNGPTFAPPAAPPSRPAPPRPPARPPAAADPDAGAALRVLTYLRLYWLTVLFGGGLAGGGLAAAAWFLLPARYESYALLQVASAPAPIGGSGDPSRGRAEFATYLKTTASLIKSEFVLNAALADPQYRIADLPTLKEQKDPIKYLDERLAVSNGDTEVIRVSLDGDRPDDVRKIVDAVKDAYYREVVEREVREKREFRVKVEKAQTALAELLKAKAGEKAAPGRSPADGVAQADAREPARLPLLPPPAVAPPAAPVLGPGGEPEAARKARFQVTLQRVFGLESQLQQLPLTAGELAAEAADLRTKIDALRSGPPADDVLQAAEKDPAMLALAARVVAAKREADYLAAVVQNPASDRVARAKAAAAEAETAWAKAREDKARTLETARRQSDANPLFARLDKVERDLRNLQERERVARQQLADAKKELADTAPPPEPPPAAPPAAVQTVSRVEPKGPVVDPEATDLLTHDEMYRRLTAQLIGLGFELDSPPRVRKLQDASAPVLKDGKKQVLGTVAAGLFGFALVGLSVVGYESAVRRVSGLADLTQSSPAPVVGVVPYLPDATTARDPAKRAAVAEAIDKLRAHVAQAWLGKGAATIAVTSPVGDEGKAFTAFGLASSLAQAGYKTVLIDFDLRQPALHPYAGVPNAVGVCEVLRGEADVRRAVLALPSGLHFLPAGRWSDEARQAAAGGRLETLLSKLREPFDCVVLHGHALLTVAESVEIARRSEAVLLCTLYRETRLPLLKRAADRLAAMEVPYAGVVYLGATPEESLC